MSTRGFDVVVTDLSLGLEQEGGLRVIRGIKGHSPNQRIILHTDSLFSEPQWRSAGADAYVQKTADRQHSIKTVIEKALALCRERELM